MFFTRTDLIQNHTLANYCKDPKFCSVHFCFFFFFSLHSQNPDVQGNTPRKYN